MLRVLPPPDKQLWDVIEPDEADSKTLWEILFLVKYLQLPVIIMSGDQLDMKCVLPCARLIGKKLFLFKVVCKYV